MIERMLNKNQSMEQHSARINNLTETLTECENKIRRLSREQSEIAQTVKKLDAIEIFNNMEDIVYEILDNVIMLAQIQRKTMEKEREVLTKMTRSF